VIGVTTPVFEDRHANAALHAEFREPDYLARMSTLLRQGQAFVGLPGGLGTLSECAVAWCLASIGHLGGPLLLFRDPWEPVFEAVSNLEEVSEELGSLLRWIDSPRDLARSLGPA
jgi:predicted Rossmann-fold nucleotide-binding protein